MIPLIRMRTAAAIHANFKTVKQEEFSLKLLRSQREILRGKRRKHKFESGRWKPSKDQLFIESNNKCAYCEAPTAAVAYGDVEHYRPKSKYWWLAYALDNYLVSCTLCNQLFKSDKFPRQRGSAKLKPPRVRRDSTENYLMRLAKTISPDPLNMDIVADFEAAHRTEGALLLNPYVDDPAEFFAWDADDNIGEVALIANPNNARARAIVKAAVDVYGLNRSQLLKLRYIFYQFYI